MKTILQKSLPILISFLALVLSNTAVAQQPPARLDQYDAWVGTYDYLHPERFEMIKSNPNAPQAQTRLFTPEEFAVASENNTVTYEAAVRMGLFSPEVQRQLGITRIEGAGTSGLTVYTRDAYGNWRFFLTAGAFDSDIIKIVSLNQDNHELGKMIQIHLSPNHSKLLKQRVDMWLYVESKVTNEYTRRSAEIVETQVKITSNDLIDPVNLYASRIQEAKSQQQSQSEKKKRPGKTSKGSSAKSCKMILKNS